MPEIPIRNLFYLICYAWDILELIECQPTGSDHVNHPVDLLAYMLGESCRNLVKRGLASEYIEKTDIYSGVKGKLLTGETLQKCYHRTGRTVCTTDEYSTDILLNQIVRSTLHYFAREPNLAPVLANNLNSLEKKWGQATLRHLEARDFQAVHLHRHSRYYVLTLRVCELIWKNLIPARDSDHYVFKSFDRDEHRMRHLFENFIRNFYKREAAPKYEVTKRNFRWSVEENDSDPSNSHLPLLCTDVLLKSSDERIIIETKFVPEIFSKNPRSHEKFRSPHLYQLMTYLENYRRLYQSTPKGILIYPSFRNDINLSYDIWNMIVQVVTIDLSRNWEDIHKSLLSIIGMGSDTAESSAKIA